MSSNNTTTVIDNFTVSKSIVDTLNQVSHNFVDYLPLIFSIFGLIGFIGNLFTYLQPELRSNTCCIYSLCGSIIDVINLFLNLFPSYLSVKYGISIPWNLSSFLCKLNIFLSVFLPHLSINFLLMAIIDRFAATCSLTSPLRRLNQMKMVPVIIVITIFISCLASFYPFILMELYYGVMCLSRDTTTMSILYIILIGVSQPIVMLIFVLLTYRNIQQSRQRVGGVNGGQHRTQFIVMIFAQIFTTSFFSLQWIIMCIYFVVTSDNPRSADETSIIYFTFGLSNTCYYLNNVKAFYISLSTSQLFRKTFTSGIMKLLPRRVRAHLQVSHTNVSMAPVTRFKPSDARRR